MTYQFDKKENQKTFVQLAKQFSMTVRQGVDQFQYFVSAETEKQLEEDMQILTGSFDFECEKFTRLSYLVSLRTV